MSGINKILRQMRQSPNNVSFNTLKNICNHYFGPPRQCGSSHAVYKTPWSGDPRVNIQNSKGMAKPYQVKQVIKAIERLENENSSE